MSEPATQEKPTAEIVELFLKQIESCGCGKFASYNLDEEVKLITAKQSKLSSVQRKRVLQLNEELKKV